MQLDGLYDSYRCDDTSFTSGGLAYLHRCDNDLVFKMYKKPLSDPNACRQLLKVVQVGRDVLVKRALPPGDVPESSVNWPIDVIPNRDGTYKGAIIPLIPKRFFRANGGTRTLDFLYLARAKPPPPRAVARVAILIRLAEILAWIDEVRLVHGDVSAKNVVWTDQPSPAVYLIDADGLQGQSPEPDHGVCTPGWTDPRLVEDRIPAHDHYSDRYALALAMYRGLLLNKGVLDRKADGSWPVPTALPARLDPKIRFLISKSLSHPLDAAARPPADEWVKELLRVFVPSGNYDQAALAVLDEHASEQRAAHEDAVTKQTQAIRTSSFSPLPPMFQPGVAVPAPPPPTRPPWLPSNPPTPAPPTPGPPMPRPAPASVPTAAPPTSPRRTRRRVLATISGLAIIIAIVIALAHSHHPSPTAAVNSGPSSSNGQTAENGSSGSTNGTVGSVTVPRTARTAPPSATAQLLAVAAQDQSAVSRLADQDWVPVVSSKKVGSDDPRDAVFPSVPYTSNMILQNFRWWHAKYPDALLLQSSSFSSELPGYWVIVINMPFSNPDDAIAWCQSQGLDDDNCDATILSHTLPEGPQTYKGW